MKRRLLDAARRTGLLSLSGAWFGRRRLTVLAYHRITDPDSPAFFGYRGNVSATPTAFAEQMRWVAERFTPVTMAQVVAALEEGPELPARPLLVTFDDGYRDNMTAALPVLRELGVPGAIFVATDHISSDKVFWWDLAAWCFETTAAAEADLPLTGPTQIEGRTQKVAASWIEAAKAVPDSERAAAIGRLPESLGVRAPVPDGLHLSWGDLREMAASGFEVGAHTCAHPILTRVSAERARSEVADSALRVGEEIGVPPLGFAYPNGQPGDFDDIAARAVTEADMTLAFTLLPGPMRRSELASAPLRIPRIYVHHTDSLSRFAAKVQGLARMSSALR